MEIKKTFRYSSDTFCKCKEILNNDGNTAVF